MPKSAPDIPSGPEPVGRAGAGSWDPPIASELIQSASPVAGGLLASWDSSNLPDGSYDLRLSVADTLGLIGTTQVTVVVDNQAPFADVTSPARVGSAW